MMIGLLKPSAASVWRRLGVLWAAADGPAAGMLQLGHTTMPMFELFGSAIAQPAIDWPAIHWSSGGLGVIVDEEVGGLIEVLREYEAV